MADRVHRPNHKRLISRAFSIGQSVGLADSPIEVADRPTRSGWEALP
jgi:hypothetical protein